MATSVQQLVRPNILKLTPYSSARSEFKGTADVFLDANENPFDTGLNRYPDPLQWKVKDRISAWRGIDRECIFLGNGSDEVIDLLIRIFCEPRQDHILILPPTYGMYRVSADIADVAVREIPLLPGFQPDAGAILGRADEHSKILFLCSPNNPTGNSFDPALVRRLAEDFPGILAIDEAYIDFAGQPGFLSWLAEFPRLVIMQTFSKAWGLAGIRLGMAFASGEIIGLLNKVKPPYNINELTQRAALEALERSDHREAWVQTILGQRAVLQQFLSALDYVERIYPSDANFLLVKVTDPRRVYQYLVGEGIIIRDRSRVRLCEGCLRITIGTPEENERLFRAMLNYRPSPTGED